MQKIFLTILILGFFVFATPVSAKITDHPFVASIIKLVQDVMPGEEMPVSPEEFDEEFDEDYVDPREVQQVLKELKDMKRELNRFAKELRKLVNAQEDLSQINAMLEQAADFDARIRAEEDLRETIQEFRDAQMWDEVQKLRAKIEIPREMKQWNKEIKRIEKLWKQKTIQNLSQDFGLNLEGAKTKIEEVKAGLSAVQGYYDSGDLESAMEAFDEIRQDFHPGEVGSIIQRFQDLSKRLKSVRDREVKSRIKEMLSEVVSYFNEGEYRIARETMDESFNEIAKIISQASSVGKKKGATKQGVQGMINTLEERMRNKAEEKMGQMEEIREQREQREVPQEMPMPIQPVRPVQPAQSVRPVEPVQPVQPTQPAPPETIPSVTPAVPIPTEPAPAP